MVRIIVVDSNEGKSWVNEDFFSDFDKLEEEEVVEDYCWVEREESISFSFLGIAFWVFIWYPWEGSLPQLESEETVVSSLKDSRLFYSLAYSSISSFWWLFLLQSTT